jgi:hypothetical protein
LEVAVGLFFGGNYIAQFIQAEHWNSGIVFDQAVEVFGFGQLGVQLKESEKNRLAALKPLSSRSNLICPSTGVNSDTIFFHLPFRKKILLPSKGVLC